MTYQPWGHRLYGLFHAMLGLRHEVELRYGPLDKTVSHVNDILIGVRRLQEAMQQHLISEHGDSRENREAYDCEERIMANSLHIPRNPRRRRTDAKN